MAKRTTSNRGLDLIKHYEKFSPVPYDDGRGNPTIGWGHLIRYDEQFFQPISDMEGLVLLRQDVRTAESAVYRLSKVPVTQPQFDALVSWVFNLGETKVRNATLWSKLNTGKYFDVPGELLRWRSPGTNVEKGLLRRRIAEAALFMED